MSSSSSLPASPVAEDDERTGRDDVAFDAVASSLPPPLDVASSMLARDLIHASLHVFACLSMAMMISTYEDYDVTHTRPNPSTLRRYTTASKTVSTVSSGAVVFPIIRGGRIDYLGAATRGMGWGPSDRDVVESGDAGDDGIDGIDGDDGKYDVDVDEYREPSSSSSSSSSSSFEDWYGDGAYAMRWKPSYNEIMLVHRTERVPRWKKDIGYRPSYSYSYSSSAAIPLPSPWTTTSTTISSTTESEERLREAVSRLYRSIDDLDRLKGMADEYMWEEMRAYLDPRTSHVGTTMTTEGEGEGISLHSALEDSMDVLRTSPALYRLQRRGDVDNELPGLIGFDWGSCAWRHCGAKADAQEAMSELYNNVGMLEPFECRFIIGEFTLEEGI
jgi:hypothetical protein